MQDSAKLLSFETRRTLNFNSSRALSIPVGRRLQFDLNRELGFDASRRLPFGRRGVLFRGYVCPVCGAAVLIDAKECDECGVAFAAAPQDKSAPANEQGRPLSRNENVKKRDKYETTQTTSRKQPQRAPEAQPPSRKAEASQRKPSYQPAAPSRPEQTKAPSQKPRTFPCPVCNAQVPTGSANCPKCTVQFAYQTPAPPADALVLCPVCDLKVASKADYCTRCGEPLSPGAIARQKSEHDALRAAGLHQPEGGPGRLGEPQRKEAATNTITWDEYMEKKKGGVYR
jgi:predicted amidophosphoribosyltransferase